MVATPRSPSQLGVVAAVVAGLRQHFVAPAARSSARALAIGALAGAALTDLVGRAVRGDGKNYSCGAGTCIDDLPLTLQMHGLWVLEAFIAVLGDGLFVAFAVADDLGRPDPSKTPAVPPVGSEPVASSVGPQPSRRTAGNGDAAGVP